jgi:nucleoid DNA-binding protein
LATKRKQADAYSFPKAEAPRSKTGVLNAVSEATGVRRKEVATVLGALAALIAYDMSRGGKFTLPGLAKMSVVKKAATKARKGINPFTKEPTIFKAKPARKLVKIRPLKALKDMVK